LRQIFAVQAVAARLEALENDAAAPDAAANDSDDEFSMPADSDGEEGVQFGPAGSKRRKQKSSGKRKTRGMAAERSSRGGPRTFATILEEVGFLCLSALKPGHWYCHWLEEPRCLLS